MSTLIARNQAAELPFYVNVALDDGVTPGKVSEVITHLAWYAGWGNAMAAVAAARDVFARHGVGADQLPPVSSELLPLDQAADAQRAASVQQSVGPVSPGLVPRDRSLVTVSGLIASGQLAQLASDLNRATDNGLTRAQAAEAVTQLAFYAGWPNAFSAVPVVKSGFESRPNR